MQLENSINIIFKFVLSLILFIPIFHFSGLSQNRKFVPQFQITQIPYSFKTFETGFQYKRLSYLAGVGKRRDFFGHVYFIRYGTELKYEPWAWTSSVKYSLGKIKKRFEPYLGVNYLGCFYSYKRMTPEISERKVYHKLAPHAGLTYYFCRFSYLSGDVGISMNKGTFGGEYVKHLTSFAFWPQARISLGFVFGNSKWK